MARAWEMPLNCDRWRSSDSHLVMDLEEKGLYFELLSFQWMKGQIPDDVALIAKIASTSVEAVTRLWSPEGSRVRSKFNLHPGRGWVNPELEDIRGHKMRVGKVRARIGRKGGISKREKILGAIASDLPPPLPEVCSANVNSSVVNGSSGSSSSDLQNYDPWELQAWLVNEYPKHRQRGPWQYELSEIISQDYAAGRDPRDSEKRIREGLAACKRSEQWRAGKIENLAKWLKERVYLNPPPEHEGESPVSKLETVAERMARIRAGKERG